MRESRKKDQFWANLVKELRLSNRLSQRQLSEQADVPRNTLRRIETGKTVPDVVALERILDVMGYDLDAILRKAIPNLYTDDQQAKVDGTPTKE